MDAADSQGKPAFYRHLACNGVKDLTMPDESTIHEPPPSPSNALYPESNEDVLHVANILRQALKSKHVPHIVKTIIVEAGYVPIRRLCIHNPKRAEMFGESSIDFSAVIPSTCQLNTIKDLRLRMMLYSTGFLCGNMVGMAAFTSLLTLNKTSKLDPRALKRISYYGCSSSHVYTLLEIWEDEKAAGVKRLPICIECRISADDEGQKEEPSGYLSSMHKDDILTLYFGHLAGCEIEWVELELKSELLVDFDLMEIVRPQQVPKDTIRELKV